MTVLATVVVLGSVVLSSCRGISECTLQANQSVIVTVLDGGVRVCDATVTASEKSYSSSMRANTLDPANCTYGGIIERTGTYTIVAERAARTTTAGLVKVAKNSCHVITEQLTITLSG